MNIVGISALYHDSAACLVVDGRVVAAAQEERFTRRKNDEAFPTKALDFCLKHAGIGVEQVDFVAFYDKPLLKFERILETHIAQWPRGFRLFSRSMGVWLNYKLHTARELHRGFGKAFQRRFLFLEHHESHAASAFFPSPFDEAAIVTLDGVGEWATASVGIGRGNIIELLHELRFPHSLGLLYSAMTYFAGFKVNSGEYKLMGLAPYGKPIYKDRILQEIVHLMEDGSFHLNMKYFAYCHREVMTSDAMTQFFGGPPRLRDAVLTEREANIAASIQAVTEEILLRVAAFARKVTKLTNLTMAGGVALNCVANARLARDGDFRNIWIQPAAGDAGGALGASLFVWHQLLDNSRCANRGDSQQGSFLGPAYSTQYIRSFLDTIGVKYQYYEDESVLVERIAELIADGLVVGHSAGRMEYGPRALGARSILADARSETMQRVLNLKIKARESFRPFAPAVLRECAHEYFDVPEGTNSPYMLFVAPVCERLRATGAPLPQHECGFTDRVNQVRSSIPAVTHVDYSARVQTVDENRNPRLYRILKAFQRRTGCAVVINTSFNVRGEPIVNSPEDCYRCFKATGMDALVLEGFILLRREQGIPEDSKSSTYVEQFELD